MNIKRTLFLAWQDSVGRRWFPVGRVDQQNSMCTFGYTNGAKKAELHGFRPLTAFPNFDKTYESDSVSSLFSNRLLSPHRPEYNDFIKWIDIPSDDIDSVSILARTGGSGEKDDLEFFSCPKPENGYYLFHFFVRGLRHQLESSSERASTLDQGERLLLMADFQNPTDGDAIALRSSEQTHRDMHLLGYLPRYLASELRIVGQKNLRDAHVEVVRVNPAPAPVHYRVLCKFQMRWPDGFRPFNGRDFDPLVYDAVASQDD